MESRMTEPETGYSSRARSGRSCLRLRWKAVPVRVGSMFCLGCSWVKAELECFAERLLRLVMLVAVLFVKLVRPFADYIRSYIHPSAAAPSRPLLGGFQQLRASSRTPLAFRYDQPVHFGSDIALQQMRDTDMHPANQAYGGIGRFRDKNRMLRSRRELSQSHCNLGRRSRISQLS